jgi:mono/diheme cytochrome c family protein
LPERNRSIRKPNQLPKHAEFNHIHAIQAGREDALEGTYSKPWRSMRLPLAIGALLILLIHGLVFYRQFFHNWERNQTAYFDQARGLAKTDAERVAVSGRSPRIEQFIVTSFGENRVDRCATCHVAADDPRFANYAEPLKTHPYSTALGDYQKDGHWERRHKFSDFGCTVCHDGQGRGLEPGYSHGEDPYWPDPLLGSITQPGWRKDYLPMLKNKVYLEANCAQCHTEESFPGTTTVERGRKLFFSQNCFGCHRIEGLSDGTLAPDLTEAGKKFKIDYLWESIDDPRANLASSFMPKFNLSEDDTRALVVFLKSRKGRNFAETEIQRFRTHLTGGAELVQANVKPVEVKLGSEADTGHKLISDRSCTACHKLGDKDGGIAPDLTWEGLERDDPWIYQHFLNPRSRVPDSIMPSFRYTDAEFRAMAAYLASLKTPPHLGAPADTFRDLCRRCHGLNGGGHGQIAIYLDPYPRDLTKAGFINSKPVERLLHSVMNGVPGTSMPAWGKVMTEEQARGVLDYVFTTFTKEPRPEIKPHNVPTANPVASNAESIARGEATFVKRCSGCHGKKADGKGPNSVDLLPRPRNLRNAWFVHAVDDKRLFDSILYGVQGTAMPAWIDYGLTNQNVGDLINFIRSLNQNSKGTQYASAN